MNPDQAWLPDSRRHLHGVKPQGFRAPASRRGRYPRRAAFSWNRGVAVTDAGGFRSADGWSLVGRTARDGGAWNGLAADGRGGAWLWAAPPRGAWTRGGIIHEGAEGRLHVCGTGRAPGRQDVVSAEARLTRTEGTQDVRLPDHGRWETGRQPSRRRHDHPRGRVTDEAGAGPQVTETPEFSDQDPFIPGTSPFWDENGQLL